MALVLSRLLLIIPFFPVIIRQIPRRRLLEGVAVYTVCTPEYNGGQLLSLTVLKIEGSVCVCVYSADGIWSKGYIHSNW